MILDYLFSAFLNVIQPLTLLAIVFGTTVGIFIGALPGLSATMGIALLLPMTFGMDPGIGLPLLMAIYCGAMYGGSISAILINTPGTAAAAATCLDGYPMAQRGEAGKALGYSLAASVFGGFFSAFALLLIAPPLSRISLLFGPPEYFALAILGLTLIGTVASGSWIKGLMSGFLGLLVSTIGMDQITGGSRFTFGFTSLLSGVHVVVALIGVFSLAQAFYLMDHDEIEIKKETSVEDLKSTLPKMRDFFKHWKIIIRSSIFGVIIGMIPGTGGDLATWVGYNEAKRTSKHPEKYGTGIVEGVIASETANNAVTGGSITPVLTLGIPGSASTAVLMGGFLVHGLRPGPRFMIDNGDLAFTIILALFATNFILLGLGVFISKIGRVIGDIKNEVLVPSIITLSVIGSYAINNNFFDVVLMFFFGIIGYLMKKADIPTSPLVIGLILGQMAENGLFQSLLISRGSLSIFITKPLSATLLALAFLSLFSAIYKDYKRKKTIEKQQI